MPEYRQSDIVTPHFKLPFTLGGINGGALLNEQDSQDDIIDCIKCIIAYPEGSRIDNPDFGVPDLLFREQSSTTIALLHDAIVQWEPRADVLVDEKPDWDEFVYNLSVLITGIGEE